MQAVPQFAQSAAVSWPANSASWVIRRLYARDPRLRADITLVRPCAPH